MPNIYEMLAGAPPAQGPALAKTAELMKQKEYLGRIGMLTGDSVISPLGKGMLEELPGEWKGLQQSRQNALSNIQKDEDQAALADYRDKMANSSLKRALAAQKKAEGTGTDWKKINDGMKNKLGSRGTIISEVNRLSNSYKPEYSQIVGEYAGPLNQIPNYIAQNWGVGNAETIPAGEWWADWQKVYTLPERNEKFGATLTDGEKAAWAAVDLNPSLTPGQIQLRLNKFMNSLTTETKMLMQGLEVDGHNPAAIRAYTGISDTPDTPDTFDPTALPGEEAQTVEQSGLMNLEMAEAILNDPSSTPEQIAAVEAFLNE